MTTSPTLTKDRAPAVVQAAVAERDAIQANLLELDGSFGKRMLEGAALTGETKRSWDVTAASLATLWQVYSAYSAVVDRAAEAVAGHLGPRELAWITTLLTGPSIQLAPGPAPLAGRDLADSGREDLTVVAAVTRMRRAFAEITAVVSAAELVWNEMTGKLDAVAAELARVTPLASSLGDEALTGNLAAAESKLGRLRGTLNSDPLSLWHGGQTVDISGADRLQERVAAAATRVDELVRLRDDAQQRIAEVKTAAATARAACDDAAAAWQHAAAKIAAAALPAEPPGFTDLSVRLADLDMLMAAGRWSRLSSELDSIERDLVEAAMRFRDAERALVGVVARRDELRGLLGAYRAKAARLGAAEDPALTERYDRAHGLLWTAPCDLAAAADAVTGYQQAVLALGGSPR
jgi:CBS domain-containing protein